MVGSEGERPDGVLLRVGELKVLALGILVIA
jgi:hypothetical protein